MKETYSHNGRIATIIHGDALAILPTLDRHFDAIITDPPYASGGATMSAKQAPTSTKYTGTKTHCLMPDFEGDALDQRSWTHWMCTILRQARELANPGAPLCVFSDWRQLPSLTDAIQWAGWTWRGVAVWDKINSRPQRGRFRQQAEFVAWASNGAMPVDRDAGVLPGVLSYGQRQVGARHHQTEKPLELMRTIVRICERGGTILDPFAGSGTTLIASLLEGYSGVGIEVSSAYYATACQRLTELND